MELKMEQKFLKLDRDVHCRKHNAPSEEHPAKKVISVFLASTRLTSEAGPPSAVSFLLLFSFLYFFF